MDHDEAKLLAVGCQYLKTLILKNCVDVDDFCLPKLFILANTLEYLDLSGCHKVTERGLGCLYHLTSLKTLVIDDLPNAENKELTALLLEDEIPWCEVVGVEYNPLALPDPLREKERQEQIWQRLGVPLHHKVAGPDTVEVGNVTYAERLAQQKKSIRERNKKELGIKGHGLE